MDAKERNLGPPEEPTDIAPPTQAGVVVFEVGGQRYGILLAEADEIHRIPSSVPLPKAPAIIEGVVNIRGRVTPVLDIRTRFRLPPRAPMPADHLMVARAGERRVALRVDRVLDLAWIEARQIEDAAAAAPGAEYVAGVAKLPDGLLLIHDLKTFLSLDEAAALDTALPKSRSPNGGEGG